MDKNHNNEIKYKVLIYDKQFNSKDEINNKIALIKNRILDYPKELSIKEIANCCISGYPICFSYGVRNKRSSSKSYRENNWVEQQLIAVDIDNKDNKNYLSYEDAINLCIKHKVIPAFIYTTMSNTKENNKYRIVFALKESVKDKDTYLAILNSIANILSVKGKTVIDTKCKDLSRIFYPGKDLVYFNENSRLDISCILVFNKIDFLSVKDKNKKSINEEDKKIDLDINNINLKDTVKLLVKAIFEVKELYKKGNKNPIKSIISRLDENFTKNRLLNPILYIYNNISINIYKNKKIYKNYRIKRPPYTSEALCPITTRVPDTLFSHLRKLPMNEIFNIPLNKGISCILPTHKDDHASARFEIDDTGRYVYHCYACDIKYDIIDLLSILAKVSILDVRNFLCFMYNIKYETEWQHEQTINIIETQEYVCSKSFQEQYPLLDKILSRKNLYPIYLMILDTAKIYIFDKDISGLNLPMFYQTIDQLLYKFNKYYGQNKHKDTFRKGIKYLIRLGLINVLRDELIPESILKHLNSIKSNNSNRVSSRRIECYTIPEFTSELLYNAEKRILEDKENCVRVTHYCRTAAILDNKDLADEIYVQDINKSINPEIEKFYKAYKARAIKMLDKKGYFLERDLLSYMKQYSKLQKEKYSHYCLPKLIKELQIKKVSFSKKIKVDYNISDKSIYKYNMYYGVTKLYIKKES